MMGFLETVERARAALERSGRASLRALRREFDLDADSLADLVDELVNVTGVAARQGEVLVWVGPGRLGEETSSGPRSPAEPRPEAERRQLTVLFCDLMDSTEHAAALDPEDWREIVRGYQDVATAAVERFDGHVAQYLGDGLLVYFGWPRAHEDDAERALRAGLGILEGVADGNRVLADRHGVELAVRIGIHTGLVVVGEMGAGATRETLAMGETANVAARLQGIAEPDTVAMSAATLRLVDGIFVTRDLGHQMLKGLSVPVHVHAAERATGVRSRLDRTPASALSAFTGRSRELQILRERWSEVRGGRGRGLLIRGEAGIGKSRLGRALREEIRSDRPAWLECRCSPYMTGTALHPLVDLQRQHLGLDTLGGAERLARLDEELARSGLARKEGLRLLARLHGTPLGGDDRGSRPNPELERRRTLELLCDWVASRSRSQPAVLLLEDLHWADPSTLELLEMLLRDVPERLLLLLTARPEFELSWAEQGAIELVPLGRLSRPDTRVLVRACARDRNLPGGWVDEIAARCDGVPLFAEELTRAAKESRRGPLQDRPRVGLDEVPTTLQDLLTSRLDGLGRAKRVAQYAAVIGREFSCDLLRAICEPGAETLEKSLARCVDGEILDRTEASPAARYQFRHALIRDAAYRSLLRAERKRLHGAVADALADDPMEIATARPEVSAHHLSEAGRLQEAATAWKRAGELATQRSAMREALMHYQRGAELSRHVPAGPERDRLELDLRIGEAIATTAVNGWSGSDAEASWMRANELAAGVGDAGQRSSCLWGMATLRTSRAETEGSVRYAGELRDLGRGDGDVNVEIAGLNMLANGLLISGRFEECVAATRELVALDDGSRNDEPSIRHFGHSARISGRAWGALAAHWASLDSAGRELALEALSLARELDHPLTLCFPLLAMNAIDLAGDPRSVGVLGEELRGIGEANGFKLWTGVGEAFRCWSALQEQRADPALAERAVAALVASASTGNNASAPEFMGLLAACFRAAGRLPEALQWCDSALDAWSAKQPYWNSELYRAKAEILLARDARCEDGASLLEAGLDQARALRATRLALRALTSIAERHPDPDRRREAARDLEDVTCGASAQDPDVRAALAALG